MDCCAITTIFFFSLSLSLLKKQTLRDSPFSDKILLPIREKKSGSLPPSLLLFQEQNFVTFFLLIFLLPSSLRLLHLSHLFLLFIIYLFLSLLLFFPPKQIFLPSSCSSSSRRNLEQKNLNCGDGVVLREEGRGGGVCNFLLLALPPSLCPCLPPLLPLLLPLLPPLLALVKSYYLREIREK